ncbi:MAG TPA: hypothetical protein VFJ99_05365 [Solirubrobacterales bacterium]|nr:hypothetical protein [Solirubrobacterales bacterium]
MRYYGVEVRGPDGEPADTGDRGPHVSATWTEVLAWTIFAVAIVAALAGLIVGAIYAITRIS